MAGKIPSRGDFEIPSALIDEHEWMADELIDGPIGYDCTLVFPAIDSECPNCLFDPTTKRSANIYRTGGPYPFANHTVCPLCDGQGRSTSSPTDTIRLRVYYGGMEVNAAMKMFQNLAGSFGTVDGLIFVIGYMSERPKFDRAETVMLLNQANFEQKAERVSKTIPWGFRKNRYFACMLRLR